MPSIYTYPRIDELSLKNLLIVSEAGGRNSRGIVYSTKSTTLGEIVELVVDTLAVGDFDEGIRNSQIDIQTDLLSLKSDTTVLKSRIDNVEGETSTYATNTRVDEVKSTLEGSIASSTQSLEAGYRSYTDDALTSYSTSTATQQLIAEATADKATSQSVTDLRSEIQTDLGNYSTTTATQSLITAATADLATSQSVTDLSSEIYSELGNYSTTAATQSLITAATADKATSQSVTDLSAEIYGELGNYSTTTATQALITTATADKATSQSVTDLSSRIFDPTTNTLSQSFADSVMTTESTTDYAEASDVTELQSQFTFDTNGNITGTSGALNTEIAAASANTSQAFATKVSNLEAQFTLNNGVPDGLSSSNIQAIQTVIAGDGYATSTDITTLTNNLATANANIAQNAGDITSLTSTVSTNTTNISGKPNTFRQTSAPSVNEPVGSLWFDTDDDNKAYILVSGSPNVWTAVADSRIAANATSISTNSSDITTNASDIASLTNSLATTNANVTQSATDITNLTGTVSTNTTNIAGNAGTISTNSSNISTNASDIATLTNNLATTDANVTQNATDVTNLDSTVTTHTTDIASNAGNITTNTTNISTNASSISTLQNDLNTAEADIVQNASNVTSLTSVVNSNTSSIGTNTTNISTNASNISTLTNDLNTAEADILSNSSNITSLTTTVNGHTGDISTNASDISTLNTGLTTANNNISANSSDITSVTSTANTNTGNITANANTISALQTTVNGNTASITNNATAISNEASARASAVSGLQSSIGGNTASIGVNQSTIATVDGKLNSSYGIEVDANGVVAGLKLLSNGTTSDMEFAADKFKFTNGSGTLTPFSIDTVNNKINFTGDVVFSSSYGDSDVQSYIDTVGEIFTTTTTISGGQIETGLIKNSTYPHSAGYSGFSTAGMGIDLDNGSIHAKEFYINSDGTSNFKGVHSAGRLGNWVVTDNALKSASSNPSIVFDPTGNYTKTGSEKIIVSSNTLGTISPSVSLSLDFELRDYHYDTYASIIPSNYSTWLGYPNSVNNATPTHNLTGTNGYFTTPNDINITQDAFGESNNSGYEHPGGNLEFSIPYAKSNSTGVGVAWTCIFDITVQEEFLKEWGATFTTRDESTGYNPGDAGFDPSGRYRTNLSLNKIGVAEFDYSVKLVTKMYRGSSSDTATTVQNATLEQTFTKILDSGTKLINLNDFSNISNEYTDNTYPYSNMNTDLRPNDSYNRVATNYHSANAYFGIWPEGTQTQGPTPINVNAGKIFLISSIEYKIEDIRLWRSTSYNGSNYDSGGKFYASLMQSGGWYSSSGGVVQSGGGYNASATAQTDVLFKGNDPRVNIGLNGAQVRGTDGYIALGDITSTDSIAQFWGDTEVYGTLTARSTAAFSDERLKQNIAPIKNSIETIKLLNPVTYRWNRNKINIPGTKHGFIAQEVRDIMPSTVLDGGQIAGVEDTLSVEYNNFIAINTSAIKKLIEKIEALEQEIQILKNK